MQISVRLYVRTQQKSVLFPPTEVLDDVEKERRRREKSRSFQIEMVFVLYLEDTLCKLGVCVAG